MNFYLTRIDRQNYPQWCCPFSAVFNHGFNVGLHDAEFQQNAFMFRFTQILVQSFDQLGPILFVETQEILQLSDAEIDVSRFPW